MKKAAIIQARCGSTRFPNKVLQLINGKPMLQFQIERLKHSKSLDAVILVTTGSPQDDPIFELTEKLNIPCYRGSEKDVLDRYFRAAAQFNVDVIARITSDCPLMDPTLIDKLMNVYLQASPPYDFVANTVPTPGTYADGMDIEIFSFDLLKRAWLEAEKPSEREHVTFFFWKNPDRFRLHRVDYPVDHSGLRLTVDYPDDLTKVQKIAEHFQKKNTLGTFEEIVAYILDPATRLPENKHMSGEGWRPSLERDKNVGTSTTTPAQTLSLTKTEEAWKRAIALIPTGAQTFSKTPNQYVAGVAPKMVSRGKGSRVWDLDGNEYIDYTLALGPTILGHSHPEVNLAAARCADQIFNSPSLPHPLEVKLAEELKNLIPSAEMIKYGKNGSDVTTAAIRLARAFTGREHVAFCGYHGWHDWHIGATARRKGVPSAVQQLTHRFHYNQIESLERIFADHPNSVAAVILEPVGHVAPKDQFLEKVKKLTQAHGAVLIFDEIITGFRIDLGGAQKYFGITPDLSTFGKAMANGFPLAFICGRADIMRQFEDVFFSFTFGGELPSIAAALKTINIIKRDAVLPYIAKQGARLRDGFNEITKNLEMPFARCIGLDFWPEIVFQPEKGVPSLELLTLFQQEIVRRGILTRAPMFVSSAHSLYDITWTLRVFADALTVLNNASKKGIVRSSIQGDIIQPVIRQEAT